MKVHTILPATLYQRGNCLKYSYGEKAAMMREHGIDLVANLWSRRDDDLEVLAIYIHQPIPDGKRLDPGPLEKLAWAIAEEIQVEGRTALIQCHAGRNRSGLLSALIVRNLLGVSGAEALATVRAGRPNAVANPVFERYLEGLQ